MKFFPLDKEEATVTVPVKVVNGKITYFYGSKMPRLREGAIGDLILPAYAVLDENWVAPLREARTIPLLEKGQRLLLAMRLERIPADLLGQTLAPEHLPFGNPHEASFFRFISVTLTQPLDLILRGTKKAILSGGSCHIPKLNTDAISLNHAYTLISTVYEPGRRSHTGNAFQRAYYFSVKPEKLWPLGDLRGSHEAEYEDKRLLSRKQRAEKRARQQAVQEREAARQSTLSVDNSFDVHQPSQAQAELFPDLF